MMCRRGRRSSPIVSLAAHDGEISSLRAYSTAAMRALVRHADPVIDVRLRSRPLGQHVVATCG
jgi:hypothetical protein